MKCFRLLRFSAITFYLLLTATAGVLFASPLGAFDIAALIAQQPWPTNSVVLLPDCSIVHTDRGYKILDASPFIDFSTNRLMVPLRFIAEELGVEVVYTDGFINADYKGVHIEMQIGSNIATVDQDILHLENVPIVVYDRTFVPLRFMAEAFGFAVHFQDNVIVVGGWYSEVSPQQAGAWWVNLSEARYRLEVIADDWFIQPIDGIARNYWYNGGQHYFWRYFGDNTYALYQTAAKTTSVALCLGGSFSFDNGYEDPEWWHLITYGFVISSDAVYIVLHSGGATMGSEKILRYDLSKVTELAWDRVSNIQVEGDYLYGQYGNPGYFNTVFRLSIPEAIEGTATLQNVGQERFSYYWFSLDQGYIYAMAYDLNTSYDHYVLIEDIPTAFYRIDPITMNHTLLLEERMINPVVLDDWVYHLSLEQPRRLLRTSLSSGEFEDLKVEGIEGIYTFGQQLYYKTYDAITDEIIWFIFSK